MSISSQTTIAADGSTIVYDVRGDGEITIVFVHGWTCDRQFWKFQIDYFVQRYRVICLDLAGHGESGSKREKYTMQEFAQDVAVVVNQEHVERVVLVGHSMSAAVIVEAEKILGNKVIGVVGIDFFYTTGNEFLYKKSVISPLTKSERRDLIKKLGIFKIWKPLLVDYWRRFIMNIAKKEIGGNIKKLVAKVMFLPNTNVELVNWIVNRMSQADPEMAIRAINNLIDWRIERMPNDLQKIHNKLRNINASIGNESDLNESVILVANVGHFIAQVKPDEFNAVLDKIATNFAEKSK